ncbi:MAG: hypothetical protein OdinLCB4_001165 [Candidatus Odinarchaeum yellowstonii]|uniref:Uncharacterized protein n=1 Tax=Odinarchaeota yellowstonii (strain LCB_4) TaxID=1841599 RepID=A0AAF0IBN2_ODILC|nr:MAG: hypothetical protein OdinLCB4_001165 [Candidatus Odinarchaeum yellowstonii]
MSKTNPTVSDETELTHLLIEIKNILRESIQSVSRIKDALEKFGLNVIDRLGAFQSQFEELQKEVKKIEALEVSIRGLRFTTKETLEKLIERVLELEKIVKSKPSVEGIIVQEAEEPKTPVRETQLVYVKQEANKSATENILRNLAKAVSEQMPAGNLITKIAETRDTLMSWTPHHPVFYEMHEWIQRIKHLPRNKPIPPEDANKLIKDIDNWITRIIKE